MLIVGCDASRECRMERGSKRGGNRRVTTTRWGAKGLGVGGFFGACFELDSGSEKIARGGEWSRLLLRHTFYLGRTMFAQNRLRRLDGASSLCRAGLRIRGPYDGDCDASMPASVSEGNAHKPDSRVASESYFTCRLFQIILSRVNFHCV